MRILLFCIFTGLVLPSFCQSKNELMAETSRLKSENAALKAEIEQLKTSPMIDLQDTTNQASYCFGVVIASNMKTQGLDSLDMDSFLAAMKDVYGDKPLKIERREAESVIQQYMQNAMMKKSEAQREAGQKYLDANKARPGVIATASGLQYQVLTEGKGKSPAPTDRVTVHYTGKLTDGSVFDSSVKRGQPATFGVNQVIAGWTEALQLMQEGDKWMLYIPYALAYGERGSPPQIPPFSTLVFEVELLKVN